MADLPDAKAVLLEFAMNFNAWEAEQRTRARKAERQGNNASAAYEEGLADGFKTAAMVARMRAEQLQ